MGLRTLVIAQKQISKEELNSILFRNEELRRDPAGLKNLYLEVESNFDLLGATGVEDELQDGVPETLQKLKEAGIRIWMLTGDKLETAMNVAITCGLELSKKNMTILAHHKEASSFCTAIDKIRYEMQTSPFQTLVIDGPSFEIGFESSKEALTEVMTNATKVIFCRMTPLQKAQVVQMIKSSKKRVGVTCAVGDGGNDVAMINEAHIGIGIIGKEGRQAARASDFAIARFKFLQKVILVHGYWYYYRLANLILYFFYRGVYFVFIIFLFGFECVFSINTIYDSIFVMLFAMLLTSVPILLYGLTEQPISPEQLLKNPVYYLSLRKNSYFDAENVAKWIFITFWHFMVTYFGCWAFWTYFNVLSDHSSFSIMINCIVVAISDLKIILETRHFTLVILIGQFLSYAFIVFFNSILFQIGSGSGSQLDFSYYTVMAEPQVWLAMILIIFVAFLPDYCLGPVRSLIEGKGRLGATFPDPKIKNK
jgi:phospholipid-translocating ATPase